MTGKKGGNKTGKKSGHKTTVKSAQESMDKAVSAAVEYNMVEIAKEVNRNLDTVVSGLESANGKLKTMVEILGKINRNA